MNMFYITLKLKARHYFTGIQTEYFLPSRRGIKKNMDIGTQIHGKATHIWSRCSILPSVLSQKWHIKGGIKAQQHFSGCRCVCVVLHSVISMPAMNTRLCCGLSECQRTFLNPVYVFQSV